MKYVLPLITAWCSLHLVRGSCTEEGAAPDVPAPPVAPPPPPPPSTPATSPPPPALPCLDLATSRYMENSCDGAIISGNITANCPVEGDNQLCMSFQDRRKDLSFPVQCNQGEISFSLVEYANAVLYSGNLSCTDWENQDESELYTFASIYQRGMVYQSLCPANGTCQAPSNVRRHRYLEGATFGGTEDEVENVVMECGDVEYELYLHVTGHISALMMPPQSHKKCPFIMAHAVINDKRAKKELGFWSEQSNFEEIYPMEGSFLVTSLTLRDFMGAYNFAEVSDPHIAVYDAIKNSCAYFAASLAGHLNIQMDENMKEFVARRLLEQNGRGLVDQLRSSLYFPSLFVRRKEQDKKTMSTEELVELLVELTAEGLHRS